MVRSCLILKAMEDSFLPAPEQWKQWSCVWRKTIKRKVRGLSWIPLDFLYSDSPEQGDRIPEIDCSGLKHLNDFELKKVFTYQASSCLCNLWRKQKMASLLISRLWMSHTEWQVSLVVSDQSGHLVVSHDRCCLGKQKTGQAPKVPRPWGIHLPVVISLLRIYWWQSLSSKRWWQNPSKTGWCHARCSVTWSSQSLLPTPSLPPSPIKTQPRLQTEQLQ